MSKTAIKSSSINDSARCQHRTVTGRRCRLAVVHPSSGLCFRHAFLRSKLGEEADLRTALAGDLPDFTSAEQINASSPSSSSSSPRTASLRGALPSSPMLAASCFALCLSFSGNALAAPTPILPTLSSTSAIFLAPTATRFPQKRKLQPHPRR